LFAGFAHHLSQPPARANVALNAVLAGQTDATEAAKAAFDHALRTVMLVTAVFAAVAGIVGWLWLRPTGPEQPRPSASPGKTAQPNSA
jgi:hypothetical protein